MKIKNLSIEELNNIGVYDYHNPHFSLPLFVSRIKERLEEKTGMSFYIGKDFQFHRKSGKQQ